MVLSPAIDDPVATKAAQSHNLGATRCQLGYSKICAHEPDFSNFRNCPNLETLALTECRKLGNQFSNCMSDVGSSCSLGWADANDVVVLPGFTDLDPPAVNDAIPKFPKKPETCKPDSFAAWASFAGYREKIENARPNAWNYVSMLRQAGWESTRVWAEVTEVSPFKDQYSAELWVRDGNYACSKGVESACWKRRIQNRDGTSYNVPPPGTGVECILTFRGAATGSDIASGDRAVPKDYLGFQVSEDVLAQARPLFQRMASEDLDNQLRLCSSVTATGHGLGGAAAELFAAVSSRLDVPGFVDAVVTFGAMPATTGALFNTSTAGCLTGTRFVNVALNTDGDKVVDPRAVVGLATFAHPLLKSVELGGSNSTSHSSFSCGAQPPVLVAGQEDALHSPAAYSDNVGCGGCAADEWEVLAPWGAHARICRPLTKCTAEEFENSWRTRYDDRSCKTIRVCSSDEYEQSAPRQNCDTGICGIDIHGAEIHDADRSCTELTKCSVFGKCAHLTCFARR
jgi:hypothetical protein